MQLSNSRKPRRLISLTPLIDVVFILLVFFMISSNFVEWRKIPLENSSLGTNTLKPSEILLIQVTKNKLQVNNQTISNPTLVELLQDKLSQHPDIKVLIKPDSEVDLQRLVAVLDEMEKNSVQSVTLVQ